MRLIIAAVGRMKSGPERELVARYVDRVEKAGRAVGITSVDVIEIVESRAAGSGQRKEDEADALLARLPSPCGVLAFDERGKSPSSKEFAEKIRNRLDDGTGDLALIIGGPDGLSPELRDRADSVISFGALTMPHQIVRILVAEQVYRAVTILTGHPYHRD